MKLAIGVVALAAAAQALVSRESNCCFQLTASGSVSGIVSQLTDGQNRVGATGLTTGTYCISSSGGLTDSEGRGCILTPPTTQFQCDTGASPSPGFSVGCDGTLYYEGSSTFYTCETGSNGENIYTSVGSAETGCTKITLNANNCRTCPSSSSSTKASTSTTSATSTSIKAPSTTTTKAATTTSAVATSTKTSSSSSTCPTTLSGTYEYPHLIIPVSSASPNTAAGTSYFGEVSPNNVSSIFNFDIPASDTGKTCSLVFLFPTQSELTTSSYSISGNGAVDFASLKSVATSATDYANMPAVATDFGSFDLAPGNSYVISTFACPAGTAVAYKLSSSTTTLSYFQDYNPSP